MITPFSVKIVGLSFRPGYPDNLLSLRDVYLIRPSEKIAAVLMREPENEYDHNAIGVHIPALGQQVGHLPRELAARLAVEMDGGRTWQAEVSEILVVPGLESQPGCLIRCFPVEDPVTARSAANRSRFAAEYPEIGDR